MELTFSFKVSLDDNIISVGSDNVLRLIKNLRKASAKPITISLMAHHQTMCFKPTIVNVSLGPRGHP